jgi:HlyD family secretion protein
MGVAVARASNGVSVDIEVARRSKALIAPAADVHGLDTANPWVLKIDGAHARRQSIKVGIVSAGKAEIVEGLGEGDVIVTSVATLVKDGTRVRTRVTAAAGSS